MTKKMKIVGIATAAVLVVSSMGVFAAGSGKIGKSRGDFETRLENGEITQEKYDAFIACKGNRGDKKAKLDEKLAAGEITQEEYDALKSKIETKHEKKKFPNSKKHGFGKDKVRPENNAETDPNE